MFTDPFVVPNFHATIDSKTYNRIGSPSYKASEYNGVTVGSVIDKLKISHQSVGSGTAARKRHLFRLESESDDDGIKGTHAPCVGYVVFDLPDNYQQTGAIQQLVEQLVGFLCGTDVVMNTPDYADFNNWIDETS